MRQIFPHAEGLGLELEARLQELRDRVLVLERELADLRQEQLRLREQRRADES